jgi:hypothetical protein
MKTAGLIEPKQFIHSQKEKNYSKEQKLLLNLGARTRN